MNAHRTTSSSKLTSRISGFLYPRDAAAARGAAKVLLSTPTSSRVHTHTPKAHSPTRPLPLPHTHRVHPPSLPPPIPTLPHPHPSYRCTHQGLGPQSSVGAFDTDHYESRVACARKSLCMQHATERAPQSERAPAWRPHAIMLSTRSEGSSFSSIGFPLVREPQQQLRRRRTSVCTTPVPEAIDVFCRNGCARQTPSSRPRATRATQLTRHRLRHWRQAYTRHIGEWKVAPERPRLLNTHTHAHPRNAATPELKSKRTQRRNTRIKRERATTLSVWRRTSPRWWDGPRARNRCNAPAQR